MNPSSLYAYQYYLQRGYSPEAAAGITGNLMVESGRFSPDVISGQRRGDSGSAGYAAQWRGDRLSGYYDYAKSQGLDPSSLDAQLGYVDHEMRTGSDAGAATAFRQLQTAQSPAQAAQMFMQHYERPNADPSINAIATRQNYANSLAGIDPGNVQIANAAIPAGNTDGIASLAPQASATLPTVNEAATSDPMSGIFSLLLQQQQQQPQEAPVAAAPVMRKAPDARSDEEKLAAVSQTPNVYYDRLRRRTT